MNVVYNTDGKWFSFLRKHNVRNGVNFWRKDQRSFNVEKGTPFYFKIRGSHLIGGRAKLSSVQQMTFPEAWEAFGKKNGVETYPEFVQEVCEVTHADQSDQIKCLVLDDLEFLKDSKWVTISESSFPRAVVASKFFEDNELSDVISSFNSALKEQATQMPVCSTVSESELVIPFDFQGSIRITFEAGCLRIAKESPAI